MEIHIYKSILYLENMSSDEIEVNLDDLEETDGLINGSAKNMRVVHSYERHHLMEFNLDFVNRSYWFCLLLFVALGIAVFTLMYIGIFNKSILAEQFIVTVIGTIYFILLVVMVVCGREKMLRSPLILFVSFFIGITLGFLMGMNLNRVIGDLYDD